MSAAPRLPRLWTVPIKLVEFRDAIIEADSRAEAIAKMRRSEWEELSDANRWTVTKAGKAVPEKDANTLETYRRRR
jgi:hypothetical protein